VLPNKREKLEITILKAKVEELKEEMKNKDVKNGLGVERMRKKIEGLVKGSKEFEGELRIVEGERVGLIDECNGLKVSCFKLIMFLGEIIRCLEEKERNCKKGNATVGIIAKIGRSRRDPRCVGRRVGCSCTGAWSAVRLRNQMS
jgi:hypothetical protein